VTLRVVFEAKAIDRAAGYLADDPDGLRSVFDAIDRLIDDPRPAHSFPFGSQDVRRLRVGRYRVLYRIDQDVISIGHLARTAPED
jgi:mRNA interferase RelE/StbE